MHAILKRPIWIGDTHFLKGVFDESNPKTKMLFAKDWFLESLEKDGHLELHHDVVEEAVQPVDNYSPETQEAKTLDVKQAKKPKGNKAES